jgi:hypothetical protein
MSAIAKFTEDFIRQSRIGTRAGDGAAGQLLGALSCKWR